MTTMQEWQDDVTRAAKIASGELDSMDDYTWVQECTGLLCNVTDPAFLPDNLPWAAMMLLRRLGREQPKPGWDFTGVIDIPGRVYVEVEDGKIDGIYFTPHGSDAGYSGKMAVAYEGGQAMQDVLDDLDGPFWAGIREHLVKTEAQIGWME